jgi:hypothetical protein
MPLARHVSLIPIVSQDLGQGCDFVVQIALVARLSSLELRHAFVHGAYTRDMVVGAAEKHGSGRTACCSGVEVCEAKAAAGS